MSKITLSSELKIATAAEQAANQEAMQRGLMATKPLTALRLAQLCELGEKMMRARRRREEAERAVATLASPPRRC